MKPLRGEDRGFIDRIDSIAPSHFCKSTAHLKAKHSKLLPGLAIVEMTIEYTNSQRSSLSLNFALPLNHGYVLPHRNYASQEKTRNDQGFCAFFENYFIFNCLETS